MKKIHKALKLPAFLLLVSTAFIACDKDFNTLGSDIIGSKNFETKHASYTATTYNKKLNPIQTNGLSSNLLGIVNDPVYGQTIANIVTQVTPTSFTPSFGENVAIDSVILTIPYFSKVAEDSPDSEGNVVYDISDSLYGNPSTSIKLSIYRNNYFLRDFDPSSEFDEAQKYYSNSNETINFDNHTGELLYVTDNFVPKKDVVILTNSSEDSEEPQRLTPRFRVRLDDPQGTNPEIIQDSQYWINLIINKEDDPELSNSNNFRDYFRGLYFKTEALSTDGNMVMLNLGDSDANLTIHYSKDAATEGERDQGTYVLNFTENRVNTFSNSFTVTLEDGDNIDGDEKIYLKGTEGSMGIIDLFGGEDSQELLDFKSNRGNWLINEANIIIYEDESAIPSTDESHKADRLYVYDVKNNTPILDYFFDISDNTNDASNSKIIHLGKRVVDDNGVAKYKIRVTEHVKNLLLDSTNTKLGLTLSKNVNITQTRSLLDSENEDVTSVPTASVVAPIGTVLHGSHANVPDSKRIELEIYYTEPNN